MNSRNIACCYHPTTVMIIDDNQHFLNTIDLKLRSKFSCAFYADSIAALTFLNNSYQSNSFINRCLYRPEAKKRGQRSIDINIEVIHNEIYNKHRFSEISVIIIDYNMANLNALDFCRKLNHPNIKRIMLTDEADYELAIKGFNEGIIDKFILKTSSNLTQILTDTIYEQQSAYFENLSSIVFDSLAPNDEHPHCCFDEPFFIDLLKNIGAQHNFAEYYIIDTCGSFMFLDFDGRPSWLIVKDEEHMQSVVFDAEMSDLQIPTSIIDSVKKREKLLQLPVDFHSSDLTPWPKYLHGINKFAGKDTTYYYAYIEEPSFHKINTSKIFSYQKYLNSLMKDYSVDMIKTKTMKIARAAGY